MNMVLNNSSNLHQRGLVMSNINVNSLQTCVSPISSSPIHLDHHHHHHNHQTRIGSSSNNQVPQRSPFAIQQLLGLSNNSSNSNNNTNNSISNGNNSLYHPSLINTSIPSSSVVSSLCISNLVPSSGSNSIQSIQPSNSNSYFHSASSARTPPIAHHNLAHPATLLSPHQAAAAAQAAHCFSSADSNAAAARLAYFNSPAAAAFMSASMHGLHQPLGVNVGMGVPGSGCITGPTVSNPMSMFHSFATESSMSPRPEGCSGKIINF